MNKDLESTELPLHDQRYYGTLLTSINFLLDNDQEYDTQRSVANFQMKQEMRNLLNTLISPQTLTLSEVIGSLGYSDVIWNKKKGSHMKLSDASEHYTSRPNELTATIDKRLELTNRVIKGQGLPSGNEHNSSCNMELCLMYWNIHLQDVEAVLTTEEQSNFKFNFEC